ncbi:MAG: UvrD-helicase domain-containing protein [Planctomycetia bacterium]|nr:UvrD-helicase domain-containing protein [Planctomycetia bacterium]
MIATQPHKLIRASAGTGKTFQLSNRYLALLCAGAEPDEILATTFTRKAAAEILDRLLTRLARAAGDERKCAALAKQIGVEELSPERAQQLLVELARRLDRLRVLTLDSFFAQVAGRFALELALPPGWAIADVLDDARLRSEAIEAVLADGDDGEVQRLLGLMTRGEAERSVSQLIRDTVSRLYSVFCETDAAAWSRFPKLPWLSNVELTDLLDDLRAAALPADKRFAAARDKNVAAAEEADWPTAVGTGLAGKILSGDPHYYNKPIPAPLVALYQRLIDHARAVELVKLAYQTEATYALLARFDREYRRLKRERRQLRFEDVTAAVAAGASLAARGGLAYRLDSEVRHILLDEFQDTSLAQWQAVHPLAARVVASPTGSLFCVGDVKQAIYGWRGGLADLFDSLEMELPGLTSENLSTSYRSAPAVIEAVNAMFGPKMATGHGNLGDLEPAVKTWCDEFPEHTTVRTELAGYVTLETAPLAAEDEDQSVVTLRYACQRIAELAPQVAPQSIGVLVRRNETVARLIFELRKLGIDASEEGGNPLTDSAAVCAVLSLLRLADHPGDSVAAFHVARSPLGPVVGLTDHRDMQLVCDVARRVRRTLLDDGYGPTIGRWSSEVAGECSTRDAARLKQLADLAGRHDAAATLRPSRFVEWIEETRVPRAAAAQVRVMTVHQAKGLQFDVVVLPELDVLLAGQPPAYVAGRPAAGQPIDRVALFRGEEVRALLPDELQDLFRDATRLSTREALSLLYVMVTRAVHALHMVIAPTPPTKSGNLHKTFAGLLRAALTDGQPLQPEQVVYEHGDVNWRLVEAERTGAGCLGQRPSEVDDEATGALPQPPSPLAVRLAPSVTSAARELTAQSPSQLEGGSRRMAASALRDDGAAARLRGNIFHGWFEQIEWLSPAAPRGGGPDDETLRRVAREVIDKKAAGPVRGDLSRVEIDQMIAEFRESLKRPEIAAALSEEACAQRLAAEGAMLVVRREQRIAAHDDERMLYGQIDRLVLAMDDGQAVAAEVLDFKTDSLSGADPAAIAGRVDFYRPQLAAYRGAVARMYRLDPKQVRARLLFVDNGVVAEV